MSETAPSVVIVVTSLPIFLPQTLWQAHRQRYQHVDVGFAAASAAAPAIVARRAVLGVFGDIPQHAQNFIHGVSTF